MAKEMLINVSAGEECRIAIVEDGKLEELYMERTSSATHVGNVYKGKVTNVEASIQAAFIDFGIGRNGFLHISDLMPSYFGRAGEGIKESVGRKMARRDRPPIQHCLRRGDEIIVQVIKEGLGTKGPTLSSYLSIPGRILVMMPGVGKSGVSKKIEDEDERRRLRDILDKLNPPKDAGFIIRTAGVGRSAQEIERDFKYLMRLWENIEKADTKKAPLELYAEGDLVMRTVRDVYTSDIERITVDDKDTAKRIKEFFKLLMPRTKNKVELYDETVPLFHEYKVERDIEMMNSRTVPLPSGGSLVIDQTEALVAIDVNSGKSRADKDAETMAFKTDMEAADEIPRQLKLRDLGGVVVCDFIDLHYERHRRELEARLDENLKKDRAKTRFLAMSEFGLVELTRQRMRPSLKKSVFQDCPHCGGQGLVKSVESMGLDVVRKLAIAAHEDRVKRVTLSLHPDIAVEVLNRKRKEIAELEEHTGKRLIVKIDNDLAQDEMQFELLDEREGQVWLAELGMESPQGGGGGRAFEQNRQGRDARPRTDRHARRDSRGGGRSEPDEDRQEFEERGEARQLTHGDDETDQDQGREQNEPRREEIRREEPRREEIRRDEPRRDQARRDEPRRSEVDRNDARARPLQRPAPVETSDSAANEFDTSHDFDAQTAEGDSASFQSSGQTEPDDRAHREGPGDFDGGPNGVANGFGEGNMQGGGGRRRRRRRGRRGRGGQGGGQFDENRNANAPLADAPDAQPNNGGEDANRGRQGSYSNDPGVEVFADDQPATNRPPVDLRNGRDGRNDGRVDGRNDGRRGEQPYRNDRNGPQQRGGRNDERGNAPRDDHRRGGHGGGSGRFDNRGGQQGPQRGRQPSYDERQPMPPMMPKPVVHHDDDPEVPGPGNSIHEPEPMREKPIVGRGGRGGRRGRGRGPTPQEKTAARIPVPSSDSLVARFLEQPIDVPETMERSDDVGNRAARPLPPSPDMPDADEPAPDDGGSAKPKGRRRGGRGGAKAAKGTKADASSGRSATSKPLPAVPKTGSTDAHAVDEPGAADLSEFLKPATPADLDYLPEYEDDE